MKIATWNVNSIKVRLPQVMDWISHAKPDVLCMQEIKCVDDAFPAGAFEDAGYNLAINGQKTYNGVAIASRWPIEDVLKTLPGDDNDPQARWLEAVIVPSGKRPVRVASLYLPNGNPVDGDKFPYKLAWMERLATHVGGLLPLEEAVVLAGDYNVIPSPEDVHDPDSWRGDALFHPKSLERLRQLMNLGLTDAIPVHHHGGGHYTFWNYQAGAWEKDHGIRIDHLLLSPQAADRLAASGIDRERRGDAKPSDHVPVWIELAD